MKVVLFDLGDTLQHQDTLLPGAVDILTTISQIRDEDHQPVRMGLVSDFDMPHRPAEIPAIRQRYLAILDHLRIRNFFEPVDVGVTLSTEVGVHKPDPRVFRAALDKFSPGLAFESAMRFSHQDSQSTNGQEWYLCRSAPRVGRAPSASWGSLFRGAALEVPDDSLQAWPAASTTAFNGVRIPGEKTSFLTLAAALTCYKKLAT